ncbi:hypothetical protein ACIKTA_03955 [Hansschlegelia beijingensis]
MSNIDPARIAASAYLWALMNALRGNELSDDDADAFIALAIEGDQPSDEERAELTELLRSKASVLTELDPLLPAKHFNPLNCSTRGHLMRLARAVEGSGATA